MKFIKSTSGSLAIISYAILVYGVIVGSIPTMLCSAVCYICTLYYYIESPAITKENKTIQYDLECEKKELQNQEQGGKIPIITGLDLGPDIVNDRKIYHSELLTYQYQNTTFHVLRIINMQDKNLNSIFIDSEKFEELRKKELQKLLNNPQNESSYCSFKKIFTISHNDIKPELDNTPLNLEKFKTELKKLDFADEVKKVIHHSLLSRYENLQYEIYKQGILFSENEIHRELINID